MRRSDREVVDVTKINEIIKKCKCCRLGFNDEGKVYIVPLNFGFSVEDGKRVFYFHSTKQGHKIDLIKRSPAIGFEMDTSYALLEADSACNFSAGYQSIIGNGNVEIIEESSEKQHALHEIMIHNTGKKNRDFNQAMLDSVCVFKLIVEELSCKENK